MGSFYFCITKGPALRDFFVIQNFSLSTHQGESKQPPWQRGLARVSTTARIAMLPPVVVRRAPTAIAERPRSPAPSISIPMPPASETVAKSITAIAPTPIPRVVNQSLTRKPVLRSSAIVVTAGTPPALVTSIIPIRVRPTPTLRAGKQAIVPKAPRPAIGTAMTVKKL